MKMTRKISPSFIFFLATMVGCSNAQLYKGIQNTNGQVIANFCTTPSSAVVNKVKYLFIMDQSTNNQQNYTWADPTAAPAPDVNGGTDPTGSKRYAPLLTYLQSAQATPNTTNYYAAMFFNTNPVIPFNQYSPGGNSEDNVTQSIWYNIAGGGDVQSDATYMYNGMKNVACPTGTCNWATNTPQQDGGWADYPDTLTDIYNFITQDLAYEQVLVAKGAQVAATSYVIFWVSSSTPYLAGGPPHVAGNTKAQDWDAYQQSIVGQVTSIANLKAQPQYNQYINTITFNAGYYTTNSTSWSQTFTQTTLQQMAQAGHGTFINFATNSVDYTKFTVPQANVPFVLRDFWVQDASTVWWNGTLMLDTDNDGIPDQIELQIGSDPNVADSDHNGLSDGVEYFLWGSPCGSIPAGGKGTCTTAGAITSFLAVPNCGNPGTYPNVYPDTDKDYLNDCEEGMLGTNHLDFDSNQDWVPDQFEWSYNVPYLFGANGLTQDPTSDGYTDYQKLKLLYPINTPVTNLKGLSKMTYAINQVSATASQTCYSATVQNMTTMSNNDVVRIYVMESQGAVGSVRHMRVLKNLTRMNGSSITVNDGDFTP